MAKAMTSVAEMAKDGMVDLEKATVAEPSLTAKLIMVAKSIGDVPMTGVVTIKGVVAYKYRTAADILSAVRGPMLEAGLWLNQTTISVEDFTVDVPETRTVPAHTVPMVRVCVEFTLTDAVSGDRFVQRYHGQGRNAEGNGLKSAYTGALRYFHLNTWGIPTGDDDEQAHASTRDPATSQPVGSRSAPSRPPAAGTLRVVSVESNPTKGGKERWTVELANSDGEAKTANAWDAAIAETLTQAQGSGAGVRLTLKAAKDPKYPDTITDAVIVDAPPAEASQPVVSEPRVLQKAALETNHTKSDGTTVPIFRIDTDQGPYHTIDSNLADFVSENMGAAVTITSRAKGGKLWAEAIDLVVEELTADQIPF